jgi:hexosaminidase
MKKFFLIASFFTYAFTFAQTNTVNIIPAPVELKMNTGNFSFNHSTQIIAAESAMHEAKMFNFYLKKLYGYALPVKSKLGLYLNSLNQLIEKMPIIWRLNPIKF